MTHPSGEGAELAKGYVSLGVKYGSAMGKIKEDFNVVEAQGLATGEKTGKNLVESIAKSGAPAALGFKGALAAGMRTGMAEVGDEAGNTFRGRFVNRLIDGLESSGRQAGASTGKGIVDGLGGSLAELKARNLQLRQDVLNASNAYQDLRLKGTASVGAVKTAHMELIGAQREVKQNTIDIANATKALGHDAEGSLSGVRTIVQSAAADIGTLGIASGAAGTALIGVGGGLSSLASNPAVLAGAAVLAIAASAVIAEKAVFDLGKSWSEAFDQIEIATGATGEKLEGIKQQVKDVAGSIPLPLAQIGAVTASVNQAFGDTGKGAEDVTKQIGNLESMVGKVDLTTLGRGFRAFGEGGDAAAQVQVLNQLFTASQATGIPMNALIATFARAAPAMQEFGLHGKETVAVLTQLDQAGVDPAKMMFSLAHAAETARKNHQDFNTVLEDTVKQIRAATTEEEKETIAKGLVGPTSGRGGAATLVEAVKNGLDLSPQLIAAMSNVGNAIDDTEAHTEHWDKTWLKVKNSVKAALEPVATPLFDTIDKAFKSMGAWIDTHKAGLVTFGKNIVDAFAATGRVLKGVLDFLKPSLEALGNAFGPLFEQMKPLIPVLKFLGEVVGGILVGAFWLAINVIRITVEILENLIHVGGNIVTWLKKEMPGAWDIAFAAGKEVIKGIIAPFTEMWDLGKKVVDWLMKEVPKAWDTGFGFVKKEIIDPIVKAFQELWDMVKKVGEYIAGPFKEAWSAIKGIGSALGFSGGGGAGGGTPGNVNAWLGGGPPGHQTGFALPGYGGGDVVPALLEPGEHVWTKEEVAASGGHKRQHELRTLARHGALRAAGGGGVPLFTDEGPEYYAAAYAHNRPFATGGNYRTPLNAQQESAFRAWVTSSGAAKVFDPNATPSDYDMRGYWQSGGKWEGGHFPDTFKTPYDTTFSAESRYALPGTPFMWQGDNLIDTRTGQLIFGHARGGVVAMAGHEKHRASWVDERFSNVGHARKMQQGGEVFAMQVLQAESGRTPYVFGGYSATGIDCSGLVAETVEAFLGLPKSASHPMATGSEGSWLSAHGFVQGDGGPGTFRIGFYNGGEGGGHTALTLPSGINAESGGSGGGVRLGGGAAGANNPEFSEHYYLPARSVVAAGGYGGAPAAGSPGSGGAGGPGGAPGGGGGGGFGGVPGGGGGGAPVDAAAVADSQSKLDIANDKVAEAQQALDAEKAKPVGKGPKGQEAHDAAVKSKEDELEKLKGRAGEAQSDLANLQAGGPKSLVAAQNSLADATQRLQAAQAKLAEDQANPKIKPSQIAEDQLAITKATEAQTKAQERLGKVSSEPPKGEGGGGGGDDPLGTLAGIGFKGAQENLPPGFSDPTQWSVVKSGAALFKFIGGMLKSKGQGQAGSGLSMIGDVMGGSGSGMAQDIQGMMTPGAYAPVGGGSPGDVPGSYGQAGPGPAGAGPSFTPPGQPGAPPDGAGGETASGPSHSANVNITNNGVDPAKAAEKQTAAAYRGIRSGVTLSGNVLT